MDLLAKEQLILSLFSALPQSEQRGMLALLEALTESTPAIVESLGDPPTNAVGFPTQAQSGSQETHGDGAST